MSTADTATAEARIGGDWHAEGLRIGYSVDLQVYGTTMTGRVLNFTADTITVRVPRAEQSPGLQLYTAFGTAVVSLSNGAANVPVSVRGVGDEVRVQVVGAAEYVQRRMFKRRTVSLPVTLCWPNGDLSAKWEYVESHTVDISVGGLRVASAMTVWPRAGTELLVSVQLPETQLTAKAEVVGKTPDYGLRLRFTELPADVLARIGTIVG